LSRIGVLLVAAYPFLILGGLQILEPRILALATAAVLGIRLVVDPPRMARERIRRMALPVACAGLVLAAGWIWNDRRFLLFLPAVVSLTLLLAFARTLRAGPTMVETFARMQRPDLSPARIRHCREATLAWCWFFAFNATVCVLLGTWGSPALWTLYTGFIAYVLMGMLLVGEFVVRAARFDDEPVPALLRRWLPRGRTS